MSCMHAAICVHAQAGAQAACLQDVTGLVGFRKDYGATANLADDTCNAALDTLKAGELLQCLDHACLVDSDREPCAAMLELYRQSLNPARKLNIFDKVPSRMKQAALVLCVLAVLCRPACLLNRVHHA